MMRTYEDVDAEIKQLMRDMNSSSLTRSEYEAADDMLMSSIRSVNDFGSRLWKMARVAICKSLILYFSL